MVTASLIKHLQVPQRSITEQKFVYTLNAIYIADKLMILLLGIKTVIASNNTKFPYSC